MKKTIVAMLIVCVMIGICGCGDDNEFVWPTSAIAKTLPVPEATKGKVIQDDAKKISVDLLEVELDAVTKYIEACKKKGFSDSITQTATTFKGFAKNGYGVLITYDAANKKMNVVAAPASPPKQDKPKAKKKDDTKKVDSAPKVSQSAKTNKKQERTVTTVTTVTTTTKSVSAPKGADQKISTLVKDAQKRLDDFLKALKAYESLDESQQTTESEEYKKLDKCRSDFAKVEKKLVDQMKDVDKLSKKNKNYFREAYMQISDKLELAGQTGLPY